MKVTTTQPPQLAFNPVTVQITLETQEEFDRLFAVTNFVSIQKIGGLGQLWESLHNCSAFSHGYSKYHEELDNFMK